MDLPTTPIPSGPNDAEGVFRIVHPFHPKYGEIHVLAVAHRNWGEDKLYFRDAEGRMWSIDRALTDQRDPDPFVTISSGRSVFRMEDLKDLAQITQDLAGSQGGGDV